jgi:hypothetical protein
MNKLLELADRSALKTIILYLFHYKFIKYLLNPDLYFDLLMPIKTSIKGL